MSDPGSTAGDEGLTAARLLELQGNDQTVTPTATLDRLRASGRRVSKRTLSFWQEQGLLPPALRVGARGGVYPEITVELIDWIAECRDRGVKVDVIRELLPMWQLLIRAQLAGAVHVVAVEETARRLGLSREANYHLPVLVQFVTSELCADCLADLEWVLKDGSVRATRDGAVELGFLIAEFDPAGGDPEVVAWTQLTLPGFGVRPSFDDPSLIVLGLPLGVELHGHHKRSGGGGEAGRRRGRRCRARRSSGQEVLALDHV